jgi:hypothetical protein
MLIDPSHAVQSLNWRGFRTNSRWQLVFKANKAK